MLVFIFYYDFNTLLTSFSKNWWRVSICYFACIAFHFINNEFIIFILFRTFFDLYLQIILFKNLIIFQSLLNMGLLFSSHYWLWRLSFLLFSAFILNILNSRIIWAILWILKVFSFRVLFLIHAVVYLKNWLDILQPFQLIASFFLVLGHVPFRYVLLSAVLTLKRPQTHMLSHVNFQIWTGIVLFCASFELTMIFIDILMSFFMIT